MLQTFLTYINAHQIFKPTDHILLAVSGGVDSVVLVELFYQAKFTFSIAHCNFQLRGEDSAMDEEFAKKMAQNYRVQFYTKKFDIQSYRNQHGVSTQMAARELRYTWFEEIRTANTFDYVATAHHQNDNIETVLLNLVRGTGISGFHGILPKQRFVIRPLLCTTKDRIVNFANAQKLTWREDISNNSIKYQRNNIRHQVIPLLKTLNPQFESGMVSMMEQLTAVENIYLQKIAEIKALVVKQRESYIEINHQILREQAESILILYTILKPYGFDYQQTKNIWAATNSQSGKRFYSERYILYKDRNFFIVQKINDFSESSSNDEVMIWPDSKLNNVELELFDATLQTEYNIIFGSENEVFLDFDALTFPLKLRKWKFGDSFCPFGMKGRQKKVSDFLIDKKYPLALKSEVKVLMSAEKIVWLVGHRSDERFKISKLSKNILKIKIV